MKLDGNSKQSLESFLCGRRVAAQCSRGRAGLLAMQFNVSGLLKEPGGSTRSFDVDGAAKAPGSTVGVDSIWDRSSGMHIAGSVAMMRTDVGIWVQASLSCEVVCACSRCLVAHARVIDLAIDEEFYPKGSLARLGDADETQFISMDNVLDLLPTMQQYAALGIPISPLCRKDCAGMCDGCGLNLNVATCSCSARLSDPRWSQLLDIPASSGATGEGANNR